MSFSRASGILLRPTSLPGRFAIGDLGPAAFAFADFLVASGQSLWQILPLGPTGYGDSPYACYSAFGGNTLLISPEKLLEQGLITELELADIPTTPSPRLDFGAAHKTKGALLAKAFANYQHTTGMEFRSDFKTFAEQNASWLDDYAMFRALKDAHDGKPWHEWETSMAKRTRGALKRVLAELHDQIDAQKSYQVRFFRQWLDLKTYCNRRGVKMVGDVPIFVAHDSADVWTNPDQFKLNPDGSPVVVAGVPPDYFSQTGQYWGNPIFNWDRMLADGFKWWIERVRATLRLVDIARIDHFRGFAACWEIPGGDQTAERGRWVEAPGRELFTAIREALGELPIIAEDLGVITPDVEKLRDESGFPGMRILQFGFSSDTSNVDLPHNYHYNVVVYTGTHDNDTTIGWFNSVAGEGSTRSATQITAEREFCMKYLSTEGREIQWDFIRAVISSVADTAIVPLQDLLGLGTEARMNLPNSMVNNWSWRFVLDALTENHSERLRGLGEAHGRIRGPEIESIRLAGEEG